MRYLKAAIAVVPAALLCAAPALADTDSIADIGDKNLGYTVGTTGGSASVGGYTTTVDGFGTLHGSTTLVGPGVNAGIVQSYDNGFESTTTFNDYSQKTEIYYPPNVEAEWEYNTPNGSFALVCTPDKGCTTETD
jgi:hypothetical protein